MVEFVLENIVNAGASRITVLVDADNHGEQIEQHLGHEWTGFLYGSCLRFAGFWTRGGGAVG